MSARELKILHLLERGRRIAEVASELGVSYKTAAISTSILKTKLGARTIWISFGSPWRSTFTAREERADLF